MKLYTNNQGAWTGTIADAKRDYGKNVVMIDVPTSKEALMKWLNKERVVSQAAVAVSEFVANQPAVVDVVAAPPRETTASEGKISATPNRYDVMDAANAASLQDLQSAVYKYLDRIDDALSLKKSA